MKLLIVISLVGFSLPSVKVFADPAGGANVGTSPVGGGCSYDSNEDWWDECFGFSWQSYKVTKDLPSSNTVTFHYTTQTGGAVYLHYCKKGQTIYNYGFEVHNGSNSAGTQVSTQSNKNGTQARWRDGGALGAYGGYLNTTGGYLESGHYESASYVKDKYLKMVEYDKNNGTNFTHGTTWDNVGYFCFDPGAEEVTLTLKSIDASGNSLASVANLADKTVKVKLNEYGKIKRNTASGYHFLGYKQAAPGTSGWNGRTVLPNGDVLTCGTNNQPTNGNAACVTSDSFVRKMSSDHTVYAVYDKNVVKGKSDVATNSTGWQTVDKTADTYWIADCSPINGCDVNFKHSLRRESGVGSSEYSVRRESNYWNSGSGLGVESKNPLKKGTETFPDGNGKAVVEQTETLTMYPGQKVCEIMQFDSAPGLSDKANLKVCAGVKGDAQPSGEDALLEIKVKNDTVGKYGNYADVVYAKPSDKVTYKATYHPILQYAINLVPEAIRIDGGVNIANNNGSTLLNLFNDNNGDMLDWKNAFSVNSSGMLTSFEQDYLYDVGNTTKREEFNSYSLTKNDAGKSLNETAKTNANDNTKTTPSQISFLVDGDTIISNVTTSGVSDIAKAIVPYNYNNTTNITKPTNSDIVYAGENESIDYDVTVNKKRNSLLESEYATIVRGAKRKIELCYNDWTICLESNMKTGNLNDSKYSSEGSSTSERITVTIPDVPAGSKIWVRSAVYPKDSGPDDNIKADYYNADDATSWAYSGWVELVVAKRPSLQVWGGSVYSGGTLNVPYAAKRHVAGINDYRVSSTNNYYVFGSWTELNLISVGKNIGFGSGASMGYVSDNSGVLSPSYSFNNPEGTLPGGSLESTLNFCLRSPLTFANTSKTDSLVCANSTPGIGASGSVDSDNDRNFLIARFVNTTPEEREQKHIIYDNYDDNHTVGGMTVAKGITRVIRAKNTITINGDIFYEDDYTTLEQVPKLIIYANNIDISCNVNRIDAVLVAEKNINTCADSDNTNSMANSRQLVINGAVITNLLNANRTYGAASGSNSIIPAEIVNYDSTIYLWGSSKADVSKSGRITETYTHELAPRY